MQPAGQLKTNRAVCPLLGGRCGGLGAAGMYAKFISQILFSQHQLAQMAFSPTSSGFLSHCPALGLTTPWPCSPIHPWQEGKRGTLQRSDALLPDAAPYSVQASRWGDLPEWEPLSWPALPPTSGREGWSQSLLSFICPWLGSPHLPKGQAGSRSAGR